MFLVFVARPSFGLEGLWTGLTSGMFFLLIVLLGTIYYVDWEKEVRKTILKNSRLVSGHFVPFGSPLPGSRGVGGLDFMSHRLLEEMEDVDSLELLFDSSVVENEEEALL